MYIGIISKRYLLDNVWIFFGGILSSVCFPFDVRRAGAFVLVSSDKVLIRGYAPTTTYNNDGQPTKKREKITRER